MVCEEERRERGSGLESERENRRGREKKRERGNAKHESISSWV
jgi:hypothetical protein